MTEIGGMKETMNYRTPKDIVPIDGPVFDPKIHLQLEEPEKSWSLKDFGYSDEFCREAPFEIAVSTPFRILSQKGIEALRESVELLADKSRKSERMAKFIRGTLYQSPFIRDLCLSPTVNEFIGKIAGKKILPHPMSLYQGHINLCPEEKNREVDKWHTDTICLDYVLMVSEVGSFKGGHFEYFQCTKNQAIKAMIREEHEPHIVKVEFPEAGMAVLQQGNLVVHRASAVLEGTDRTTLVQSFIPDCPNFNDISKLIDCKLVDPPEYLYTEWARYKAFLSQRRLNQLIDTLPYTDDKNQICNELRKAIRDVEVAILEISDPSPGRLVSLDGDALTDFL